MLNPKDIRQEQFIDSIENLSLFKAKEFLKTVNFAQPFKDKTYPLHALCSVQNYELTKFAVEKLKANVHVKTSLGYKPSDFAHFYGEVRMATYTATSQKLVKLLESHERKGKS